MATEQAAGAVPVVSGASGAVTEVRSRDRLASVMGEMLACASASLEPGVGRAALYPGGQVAWDDCCDGQVWVRLISLTPMPNSAASGRATPCGPLMWQGTFGVGVLRCAATLDDQGFAPPASALINDTLQMTADLTALSEALQCCFGPQVEKMSLQRWDPLGPEGGCVGGEWTLTVLVDNCRCP